jgi:hypothetical protein
MFDLSGGNPMKKKWFAISALVLCLALLALAVPAFGSPPYATISGLECVYVLQPGETDINGQVMTIKGQVNQNTFYSDDPGVLPNGTNTAVLDITINLQSGMAVWRSSPAIFQPDGMIGTFVGRGGGWLKMDPVTFAVLDSKGLGVFHGTGIYEGMTMKQDLFAGDITQCPGTPFDATYWEGKILPASD